MHADTLTYIRSDEYIIYDTYHLLRQDIINIEIILYPCIYILRRPEAV